MYEERKPKLSKETGSIFAVLFIASMIVACIWLFIGALQRLGGSCEK
jgi:hypothetical protein